MKEFLNLYALTSLLISTALFLLTSVVSLAKAPPREDARDDRRAYSQGTRGCPARLGQLALFELSGGDGDYYLESGSANPLIAFTVEGEQREKVSISVGEVDDSLNYKSIWEQDLIAPQREKQFLSLPPLEVGRDYRVTFQVICPQRSGYGRSLSIWVRRVGDDPTDYDRKLEEMWSQGRFLTD